MEIESNICPVGLKSPSTLIWTKAASWKPTAPPKLQFKRRLFGWRRVPDNKPSRPDRDPSARFSGARMTSARCESLLECLCAPRPGEASRWVLEPQAEFRDATLPGKWKLRGRRLTPARLLRGARWQVVTYHHCSSAARKPELP